MTMQECYKAIGGNYEAVLGRLHSEALIQKIYKKFLRRPELTTVKTGIEKVKKNDYEHTIELVRIN